MKLLDQQQRLSLQTNQKIEILEHEKQVKKENGKIYLRKNNSKLTVEQIDRINTPRVYIT